MLAPSLLRRHPEQLAHGLAQRGWDQSRINAISQAIVAANDQELDTIARNLPNLPASDVPPQRVILRQWGEPLRASWHRPHWEIMAEHGVLDTPHGIAIAGPRFILLRGWGAQLERALLHWMIDFHTMKHSYEEIAPPLLITTTTATQSGHLPHFRDEMYAIEEQELWLNPTAEIPLIGMYSGELLPERALPIATVAGIPSFRREGGSPGRLARGLLRLHQFYKVELVQITTPPQAATVFDAMTTHAEAILEALAIPYRTVDLPGPELSFAAARGRDIEAWFPGLGEWIEVSSISDCSTFQSRRATIRYQPVTNGKPRFPHTLNASGLAVGRTLAVLVEQCLRADGTITMPETLQPYFNVNHG